ncbi:F-box protein [Picochlorum sp. SENEW3]|nr:F-box protein [Picochlorum sp. SENEW3]
MKKDGERSKPIRQKKAVPPGYLHDLLHSRHLMRTVGLRGSQTSGFHTMPKGNGVHKKMMEIRKRGHALLNKPSLLGTPTLPELFQQREMFLQKKKRDEDVETPYRCRPNDPTGLLSLPEDVLLKVVCHLNHEEIKPLFRVCKDLRNTLREAVKFHFNYATPTVAAAEDCLPEAKKPKRRKAVTAYAGVMAHLKRGQRNVIERDAPNSANSTGPRALSFTPQTTPVSRNPTAELKFKD